MLKIHHTLEEKVGGGYNLLSTAPSNWTVDAEVTSQSLVNFNHAPALPLTPAQQITGMNDLNFLM
jgi:hypothetical protein